MGEPLLNGPVAPILLLFRVLKRESDGQCLPVQSRNQWII